MGAPRILKSGTAGKHSRQKPFDETLARRLLATSDLPVKHIAARLGINVSTLTRRIPAAAICNGRRYRTKPFDLDEARRLLGDKSIPVAEIARRLGVHPYTLRRHVAVAPLRWGRHREPQPCNRQEARRLMRVLGIISRGKPTHGNCVTFDRELAVWLVADGNLPVRKIAARVGIGQRTLYENIPVVDIRKLAKNNTITKTLAAPPQSPDE